MVVQWYLLSLVITCHFRQVISTDHVQSPSPVGRTEAANDPPPIAINSSVPVPEMYLEGKGSAIKVNLRRNINCRSRVLRPRTYQRGSFRVLENFVMAVRKKVNCYESVTYTTHTDLTYLDNLVPVVERWKAPISVAIFTPSDDLQRAKKAIFYMRNCLRNKRHMDLIKELVSFHLYFNANELPSGIIDLNANGSDLNACNVNPMKSYKKRPDLFYPINVGRNVARDAATTYFVLPSDIELYPSPNLVPRFLQMISKKDSTFLSQRRVFPISIYEVAETEKVPNNKKQLAKMLRQGKAIRFHANICSSCHSVPQQESWENEPELPEMRIFTETKRQGSFFHWEPTFIGTRDDPYYDERLPWEGSYDKMPQAYILCLMDYTMSLLSDAFLVHRPGIKKQRNKSNRHAELENRTKKFIYGMIAKEIHQIYGHRKNCEL